MRLPQDRILHIDTELAGDEVRVVAECQGELVRCKDCRHRYVTGTTTQYYVCDFMDAQYEDDGYCSHGELAEGGDAEVNETKSPYMQQSRHDDGRPQEELLTHEQAWEEIGRPHGEWQMCEDDDGIYGNCSICGCDADFSHYGKAFDFCPNCGADMRTDYTDAFNEQFGDALEKLDKLTLNGGDDDD